MLTTHHGGTIEIVINERKARGYFPFISIEPTFAKVYIIASNCSFQPSSGANKCSHKPMASTRQQFYGDIVNIFGCEDQNFEWFRAYLITHPLPPRTK
jgi:hypothetical protein